MFSLRNFTRDERGTTIQSISLMSGAIAIAALAGTHLLDKAVQDGALPHIAFVSPDASNRFARATAALPRGADGSNASRQVTVDYTPTASIPATLAQPVILDPCTGVRK